MWKNRCTALIAAVLGSAAVAQATGCHEAYVAGGDYSEGDWVSVVSTVTDEAGAERMARINYECIAGIWCKDVGYAPGSVYSALAWEERAECDDDYLAVATSSVRELWSGVGCPERFSASEEYGAGDTVSVCNDSFCRVYECQHDLPAPGKFCSTPGYEPGSLHSGAAWLLRGSCSGSMAPTVASSFNALSERDDPELWSGVGCPERFSASEEYGAGDTVSVCNGHLCAVYECQHDLPAPGKFCSTPGYEPGSLHSGAAWLLRGSCSGSMAPTVASEELWSNIGCPPKFSADAEYGGGDTVSVCNDVGYCTVYQCQNDLPAPGKFCDTPGYEPGSFYSGAAWNQLAGSCSVPISGASTKEAAETPKPTSSPSKAPSRPPSRSPSAGPSSPPSTGPSQSPTAGPTSSPSRSPSHPPTAGPSKSPTATPSTAPTRMPIKPQDEPEVDIPIVPSPTNAPTAGPTFSPTRGPSVVPTAGPTFSPTRGPSAVPTAGPTSSPTRGPSAVCGEIIAEGLRLFEGTCGDDEPCCSQGNYLYTTCSPNCASCQPGPSSNDCCLATGLECGKEGDPATDGKPVCCKYQNGNELKFECRAAGECPVV
ncbi:hypothetical protein ACHAXT_007674 [Thalassiosira profunda]